MSKVFVHSKLGSKEFGLVRVGGSGLANCLFFVARGLILAHRNGWIFLRPTWERFGLGPIIRREVDKRFYFGLFRGWLSLATLRKIWVYLIRRKISIDEAKAGKSGLIELTGWWNYFVELPPYWPIVKAYFEQNICPAAIRKVPRTFAKTIAVHVRLGDMPQESRVPLAWSVRMLRLVRQIAPEADVLLFSDATDIELAELLAEPNVHRAFYGNALADIIAMSRTQLIIGTCSTFSWWSAYLTQIPIVQPKKNSGCCHVDPTKFCVMGEELDFPETFKRHVWEAFA